MKIAIYPGSFDPVTNGHIDVIERASKIFEKVIVAVGENPGKKSLFTNSERVEMIKESISHIENAEVEGFQGLLMSYARKKGTNVIIRGLRAISDFESEFQRALLNRKVNNEIETIFIMTKEDYVFLNSSIIKELAMFRGTVKNLVPEIVELKLKEKFQ